MTVNHKDTQARNYYHGVRCEMQKRRPELAIGNRYMTTRSIKVGVRGSGVIIRRPKDG